MKTTKTEKTPLLTTHKATTPAPSSTNVKMLVTPALAAEWLKSNTRNRSIDLDAVDRLVEVIKSGGWRTTHQGIAIGSDGTLYDGQHRLRAIVKAGVPVMVEVTTGLVTDDLPAIDSNVGKGIRTPADIMKMARGVTLTRSAVAALSFASILVNSDSTARRVVYEMLDKSDTVHGEAMRALYPILVGSTIRIGSAAVFGPLIIAWASNPTGVVEFAGMIQSGENLPAYHPALTLRNYLFSRVAMHGTSSRLDTALRVFAAFDAYVRGDDLKMLKASIGARDRYVDAWRKANG